MSYKGTGNPGRVRRRGKLMARNNAQANISQAHNNPIITNPCEGVTADVIDCLVTDIRCLVCGLSTALLAMTSPPSPPTEECDRPLAGLAAEMAPHGPGARALCTRGARCTWDGEQRRREVSRDLRLSALFGERALFPRATFHDAAARVVRARPERANRN